MSLLDLSQLNLKVPLIYPYFPQIAHYFGAGFIPTKSESDHNNIIFLLSSEFMFLKVILFDFDFTLKLSANNTSYNTLGESEGKQSESVKVGTMNLYLLHGCMLVRIQSVLLGHPVSFHGVGKDVTLGGDSNDVPFGTSGLRHFLELPSEDIFLYTKSSFLILTYNLSRP